MKGTYKCDGCKVKDPDLDILTLVVDYKTGVTTVTVTMYGKNEDPDIPSENDGAEIKITNLDSKLPATTTESAVKKWAEDYLQKFKQ